MKKTRIETTVSVTIIDDLLINILYRHKQKKQNVQLPTFEKLTMQVVKDGLFLKLKAVKKFQQANATTIRLCCT